MGWGRQRKLQEEGEKKGKEYGQESWLGTEKKVERQNQIMVGQHVGSSGN